MSDTANRLRELREKATQGEWHACTCSIAGPCPHMPGFRVVSDCEPDISFTRDDTAMVEWMVNNALSLTAELERLEAKVEYYEARDALIDAEWQGPALDRYLIAEAALAALTPEVNRGE